MIEALVLDETMWLATERDGEQSPLLALNLIYGKICLAFCDAERSAGRPVIEVPATEAPATMSQPLSGEAPRPTPSLRRCEQAVGQT